MIERVFACPHLASRENLYWTSLFLSTHHSKMRASLKVSEAFEVLGLDEVSFLSFFLHFQISHTQT